MNSRPPRSSPAIMIHLAVAWALLIFSLCTVIAIPVHLAAPFLHSVPREGLADATLLAGIVAGLLALVALVFVALHLFLHLWFRYLRRLPHGHASEIERRLPSVLNVAAFEPQYSRVRQRYFRGHHDT